MRVLVVFLQLLADILRSRSAGQQAVVQHDRCSHSLVIVIHNREENRGGFQAAHLDHLGNVLVLQSQAVNAGRIEGLFLVLSFVVGDHFFAAAGVTGEREAGERVVSGNDAHADQRRCAGDKAGRVAARVGNAVA